MCGRLKNDLGLSLAKLLHGNQGLIGNNFRADCHCMSRPKLPFVILAEEVKRMLQKRSSDFTDIRTSNELLVRLCHQQLISEFELSYEILESDMFLTIDFLLESLQVRRRYRCHTRAGL